MTSQKPKKNDLRFGNLYWQIRKEYFVIMHDASQAYDKIIMTFSTISLGFSFGLVSYKGIANLNCFAILAGFVLILSIGLSLYSLWLRQDFSENAMRNWKKVYKVEWEYNNKEEIKQFENSAAKKMVYTQALSGIFFVSGLFFILVFVTANLH